LYALQATDNGNRSRSGPAWPAERAEGKRALDTESGLREEVAMSEPRMLRPMEYGEIFNEAVDLYKRNFLLFAGIGAVVFIPYSVFLMIADQFPILATVAIIGLVIPMAVAYAAMVKALADRYMGRDASIAASWQYALRRLVPYLLTCLLLVLLFAVVYMVAAMVMGVLIALLLMARSTLLSVLLIPIVIVLFCIPVLIALFCIYFSLDVMIVEDRYYFEAIRRSWELARGQWLRIFVILVLTWVLSLIMMVAFGMILLPLAAFTGGLPGLFRASARLPGAPEVPLVVSLVMGLASGILQSVVTPIYCLLGVLLYFDVRVRKEGYDIELLAQEIGEFPAGGGPSIAPA
jgi:hypothetical protein